MKNVFGNTLVLFEYLSPDSVVSVTGQPKYLQKVPASFTQCFIIKLFNIQYLFIQHSYISCRAALDKEKTNYMRIQSQIVKKRTILLAAQKRMQMLREQLEAAEKIANANRIMMEKLVKQVKKQISYKIPIWC